MKSLPLVFGLMVLAIDASRISLPSSMMFRYRYYGLCRDSDNSNASSTERLRKHLFCAPPYDAYTHPNANDHKPTIVKLRVFPQAIDFVRYPTMPNYSVILQLKKYTRCTGLYLYSCNIPSPYHNYHIPIPSYLAAADQNDYQPFYITTYVQEDTRLAFTFTSWFSMSWVDPRLTWTKDQFPNDVSLSISSRDIWVPSPAIFDDGGTGEYQHVGSSTECLLTMNGTATCTMLIEPVTRCAPNYQHWPFDTQNCTIRLGSWKYAKDDAVFQLSNEEIEMGEFTENLEWKIRSVNTSQSMHKYRGSPTEEPLVFFNIILERRAANREATVVVPAIVLIIISLTVIWLDPMSVERMFMAGLNVICHFLCCMELHWQIPSNGASLPSILIFYKNSLIIAGVVFFLTAFLRQLKKMSIPAPDWLTSTTSVILESRAGQFVLLATLDPKATATLETAGEDNAGLVESNSSYLKVSPGNHGAWYHLATLLDRLSFAGVLATYAITLLVLIPGENTYN